MKVYFHPHFYGEYSSDMTDPIFDIRKQVYDQKSGLFQAFDR